MPATVYLKRLKQLVVWSYCGVDGTKDGQNMERLKVKKGISRAGIGPGECMEAGPCRQCWRAWAAEGCTSELWWETRKTVGDVSRIGFNGTPGPWDVDRNLPDKGFHE